MAGFKRKKMFLLKWDEESEFSELEVIVRLGSIGEMIESRRIIEELPDGIDMRPYIVAELAKFMESWNYEGDDGPVPVTIEGIMSADYDMVLAIRDNHLDAVSGALNKEKKGRSNSGIGSEVADLPMEPLSTSQKS